jgi:hypothetical protein
MAGLERLLWTLSAEGPRGFKLADIISDLVAKGGQLGELVEYDHPDRTLSKDGGTKCRRMRPEWLDRLGRAVETEAIDRLDADRIVEILLQGK